MILRKFLIAQVIQNFYNPYYNNKEFQNRQRKQIILDSNQVESDSSSLAVTITFNYEALNRFQKTDFELYIWKRLTLINDTDYYISDISKMGLECEVRFVNTVF